MFFTNKIETYSVSEFLGRESHTKQKQPQLPLYGFLGLNVSPNDFNMPYVVVFGVAGIVILSTIIENILISQGNPRSAEMVESFTKILMPIGFYIFLAIGIFKVFL